MIAANPGIEEFLVSRDPEPPWIVYMFPHGDTILLGGTNDEGNWDTEPKAEVAERIMAGCCAIEPRLRGRRSTASACGRDGPRCGWNPSLSAAACCGTTTAMAAPGSRCPGLRRRDHRRCLRLAVQLRAEPGRGDHAVRASWQSSAISAQSGSRSRRTLIKPRPPT